jgi:vancomycin resistance protein YoaR
MLTSRYVRWGLLAAILAWAAGFAGLSLYARQSQLPRGLSIAGWEVGGTPAAELETALARRLERLGEVPVRLADPGGHAPQAALTLRQLGLRVDPAKLAAEWAGLREGPALHRARQRWRLRGADLPLPYAFDPAALEAALQRTWPALYAQQPVNARREITPDDQVRLVDGRSAYRVDTAELTKRLAALVPAAAWNGGEPAASVSVELPMKTLAPEVTLQTLEAQGIVRKLAEFTTAFPGNSSGRTHNIQATAQTVNDRMVKPGDLFDYSQIIGETEKTYGYQDAPVIVNGKLVPGIGGGICQVSSTLYNAILRAGLEVVERRNHSLPVSYVPLGLDATFASGHINFRFRNNTSSYLLIRTETDNNRLTVKLFGNAPANVTYDVESRVVQTLPPPDKYVRNPKLKAGARQVLQKGKPGYVVETYRTKKVDGKPVETVRISRDTYSAQPNLIATNTGESGGTGPSSPPPAPIVEDGIKGPVFP